MLGQAEREIREFIVTTFLFGTGGDAIADGDSLIDKGIVDSTGVLELVAFIGERYGVQVADEELVADNFASIEKLAAFVKRKAL
jgi:acyl carrier protein